eukprot:RCo050606
MAVSAAALHLQRQLQQLKKSPVGGFSVSVEDDLFTWTIWIAGPQGSPYSGGTFRAVMTFPVEFPNMPPTLRFLSEMWHPNVYPTGVVCVSILHPPGTDQFGYEAAEERWNPIQSVSSVLISVISMLSDPNTESPANLDAAIEFQRDRASYDARVRALVGKANAELPDGFEPVPTEDAKPCDVERGDHYVDASCMSFEEEEYEFDYGSGGEEDDEE